MLVNTSPACGSGAGTIEKGSRLTAGEPGREGPVRAATIEVRIREVGQIFNSLDPSPFAERDLDDDAEAHIVSWAREVDTQGPFRIVVHLPASEAEKARERGLDSAIGNYFSTARACWNATCATFSRRTAPACYRHGVRQSIGWPDFRAGVAGVGQSSFLPGIMIFGWAANWRPADAVRRLGRTAAHKPVPAACKRASRPESF
jgi:hypothetical protein